MESKARQRWTVILLGIATFFLFADQNLMAPNLTMIATEFGFTDVERDQKLGGDIALMFWLFGGTVSLLMGPLTDRVNRRNLFVLMLVIGEVPCFLTGFAENYTQLLWLRGLTGVGIGAAIPLLYSLLGDLFAASQRARATAVMGFSMGLGIALGQLLAGSLGPTHGWRLPFMLVAAPNFLVALLFLITVREPKRGGQEAAGVDLSADPAASGHGGALRWSDYREVFRTPTVALVFLQGVPGTVPWGVFFTFLNDFYAQDKGYSVQAATLVVMAIGGAAILGGFLGGLLGNRIYNRNPAWLPIYCGFTTLVGIIPTAMLLNYPSQQGVTDPSLTFPLLFGALCGFTVAITGSNVRAILLNVTAPDQRGSVFALYNLADDLGRGLGPWVIGLLVGVLGRTNAFNAANLFWVFCGVILIAMSRTFPRDEAALQERLRARAAAA